MGDHVPPVQVVKLISDSGHGTPRPMENEMNAQILQGRILALVLAASCLASARAAVRYNVVSIWPNPITSASMGAYGINNAGDVVGYYSSGLE